MQRRNKGRRNRRRGVRRTVLSAFFFLAGLAAAGAGIHAVWLLRVKQKIILPEELLVSYMGYIEQEEYDKMYALLDVSASGNISEEDFIKRNSAIYEGIGMQNMTVTVTAYDQKREAVTYETSFDTLAGAVSFTNEAFFLKGEDGYGLIWEDSLIFPGLRPAYKVRVASTSAKRGQILDRNGQVLAGPGTASSVGIVPGKLEDREVSIQAVAGLLEITPEEVEKKLSAGWVKDDYFVPVKTIPKVDEIEWLIPLQPDETIEREKERQEELLRIPGVQITDIEIRQYPLGEAAAHLIGYVQNVTAEDLEEHEGEGYTASSVIGRTGMEGLFEKELKGEDGCRIYIANAEGKVQEVLAERPVQHGADIRLTMDAGLQQAVYGQYWEDKSCTAAMDPYTGEVLALVSTPSYDNNLFISGLSAEQWNTLNEDEARPMYNRFRQTWCPGSTFKPVTAAIGLASGAVDPSENFGQEGLSWQKDSSWGNYHVTTLHAYEPVILENALIYSDNIYFAKAALKIGAQEFADSLDRLGFQEVLPFEIRMGQSQYSNSDQIETEIQLADSGYGQGQILVNPLHLACIYSAFLNGGNMQKPHLLWQQDAETAYWIPEAIPSEAAVQILEGLKKVVNDPHGTGYQAHREDVLLAGKTGTAEIKASQTDTTGTELGWFAVFTPEKDTEHPILLLTMVEDVKERGGSGYVVGKSTQILDAWFQEP